MIRNPVVLLLAVVLLVFGRPAHASPDRVALVIGNGNYSFATRLTNPANDAADMAKTLREIGFDVVDGVNLDRRAMEEKIRAFGDKLDVARIALFFYAGHGLQVAGRNYLVPVDAKLQKPGDLGLDTIDVSLVMAQMEAQQRVNLVFLDACRDNPLARSFASTLGASRSTAVGQGLASIQSAVGTMIAFATEPDKVALDGAGRNSPFTTALLKHIGEPGVDISVMMRRVRNDVLASTSQRQVPWDHSSLTDAVVLVPGSGQPAVAAPPPPPAAVSPAAVARSGPPSAAPQPSAAEADRAWTATRDATSPAVLQAFIRRYGTTIYADLARARLKEMQAAAPKQPDKVAVASPTAAAPVAPPPLPVTAQSLAGDWKSWRSCPSWLASPVTDDWSVTATDANHFTVKSRLNNGNGQIHGNRVSIEIATIKFIYSGTVTTSEGSPHIDGTVNTTFEDNCKWTMTRK